MHIFYMYMHVCFLFFFFVPLGRVGRECAEKEMSLMLNILLDCLGYPGDVTWIIGYTGQELRINIQVEDIWENHGNECNCLDNLEYTAWERDSRTES